MASPLKQQYFSSDFVVSAGCVLFRKNGDVLEMCIIHDRKRDAWILPKGRKDCGESIPQAAIRETFEETGYTCELLPCRMTTRAPIPGINGHDEAHTADNITEPFSVLVEERGVRGLKLVWWFLGKATSAEKMLGTQTDWEDYDSHFVEVEEACARLELRFRDTAKHALAMVRDGNMGGL
uniref:Nudix hydrolase domain-containing protein n=1 Tax=Mycena chlorophos TaxID=658473 RepID=A0ABQ0MBY3_MYCCL|nr:predicted protein [Mycena chlorophos]